MRISASPPLAGGERMRGYDLTLRLSLDGVDVSETAPGNRLPTRCPERHIVAEGVFCLELTANQVSTGSGTALLWHRLGEFLVNQWVADRLRLWPAGRWMSHGPGAALAQLAAEEIAAANGWSESYADLIENGAGWLAGHPAPSIACERVDTRQRCPDGCALGRRSARRGCPRQAALTALLEQERRRREAERLHFDGLRAAGVRCCGSMDGCQLAIGNEG